jgi:hypothetical protein
MKKIKTFLKEYRIEVIVVVSVVIGIILLTAPFGIKNLLHGAASASSSFLGDISWYIVHAVRTFILYFTVWDIVGLALIILPIAFLLYRIRHRYLTNPANYTRICPRCGSAIERVHRSFFDRLLSNTLMPRSRRFRCKNEDCNWSGLRR